METLACTYRLQHSFAVNRLVTKVWRRFVTDYSMFKKLRTFLELELTDVQCSRVDSSCGSQF
jgi:hypothetical protein